MVLSQSNHPIFMSNLYKTGLVIAATSFVAAASAAFLLRNLFLSTLVNQNVDLFYAIGASGLDLFLFTIHIYVTETKRTLQHYGHLGSLDLLLPTHF
uniref:Uncharacterized protein n=1 Tax=Kalanchoe fedtschenkoi TaxID=63787 RepID=A0A7N0UWR4_KALFE